MIRSGIAPPSAPDPCPDALRRILMKALAPDPSLRYQSASTLGLELAAFRAGGQFDAHLAQPRFNGALWGVKIVSLDSGKIIFEHHADRLMSPASNSKLYAGALALDRLGADYRIV